MNKVNGINASLKLLTSQYYKYIEPCSCYREAGDSKSH